MNARPLSRFICRCALFALAAHGVSRAAPPATPVSEDHLKAAFVYNFALFTEWPEELPGAGAPLNICINHDGALRPALAVLQDKPIKGRRIAVIRLPDGQEDVRHCQVLFLGSADRDRWERIKKNIGGASVLTVSDDGDIGRSGAIITLYLENGHVAFEIDMDAARKAHLALSSRLLRLARAVR